MDVVGWVFDFGYDRLRIESQEARLYRDPHNPDRVHGRTWLGGYWIGRDEEMWISLESLVAYINSGECVNPLNIHVKENEL